MLTSSAQVEALRLLSEWWDAARRDRAPWGRRRAVGATRGTVVIDVADLEEAAAFWSAALDAPVVTGDPAQDRSVSLGQAAGGLRLLLQRVPEHAGDRNAVHLDLETDDPEAAVARLTAIGARRERQLGHGAWVLADPAGNRFCVLAPETPSWSRGTRVVAGPTPAEP